MSRICDFGKVCFENPPFPISVGSKSPGLVKVWALLVNEACALDRTLLSFTKSAIVVPGSGLIELP